MLKNFKLITSVILVTASSFGAVAQTETYKDVVLDGKPAKLNVKTGEVVLVGSKKLTSNDVNKTTADGKSVIEANLIKNASNKAKSEEQTSNVNSDTVSMSSENQKEIVSTIKSDDEVAIAREKATAMVYEVSKPVTSEENNTDFHKVIKGETLYALSKRYGTTLNELKKANNLETTLIKIGQNLRVRNFDDSEFGHASVWIVSKGDTLYNIAKKNNTTVASIKSLNGLVSNLIKIGQKLQLK